MLHDDDSDDAVEKVSKSPNRSSLVEYEMKKAGIFKSKLALIMYTLAQRCVFSLSNIVTVFVFRMFEL